MIRAGLTMPSYIRFIRGPLRRTIADMELTQPREVSRCGVAFAELLVVLGSFNDIFVMAPVLPICLLHL